jgi:hypothetical protein
MAWITLPPETSGLTGRSHPPKPQQAHENDRGACRNPRLTGVQLWTSQLDETPLPAISPATAAVLHAPQQTSRPPGVGRSPGGLRRVGRGLVLAALTIAATALVSLGGTARAATWPNSMAAIGDSFSTAFNAHPNDAVVPSPPDLSACPDGLGPFGDPASFGLPPSFGLDCPSNSWSTGTNPAVNSLYQRILAHNPAIAGHAANYAVTAVSASDLPHQATLAANQGAELVTIDIGINDACAPLGSNDGQQTPPATFGAEVQQAMSILASAPSHPHILFVSIPNLNRTWSRFHNDPNAQVRWLIGVICPPLLSNPTSTAPPDVARRLAFLARIALYNLIEQRICSQTPNCQTDHGALFLRQFGLNDIATVTNTGGVNASPFNLPVLTPIGPGAIPNSTGDYWHPTLDGQTDIARLEWTALGMGQN